METRLQLRRRLLRIENAAVDAINTALSSSAVSGDTTALVSATARLRVGEGHPHMGAHRSKPLSRGDGASDVSDEGEADDDEDDESENGENEDDEEEESTIDSNNNAPVAAASVVPLRSDKCETSPVVKLLFSRHDATRSPTVCFDYPPHLNATREYVARTSGEALRVVALSAQDCRLFYRTHWERNCVKNAFAVAGLTRTIKKWSMWHIAWAKHVPKTKFKRFKDSGHAQVFNHLPDPWVIGRKDRLMRTLASSKRRFGASYSFFPEGFTLPDQMDAFQRAIQREDAAMAALAPPAGDPAALSSSSSMGKAKGCGGAGGGSAAAAGSIWILKPPASACGRGIRVITAKDVASISKDRKYVVQRYIAHPLLLDGYKFDLRLYVVVTSVDPLRIYAFDEGIARFCTSKYSLEKLANRFSHLTNYSVNKANDCFVENTDTDAGHTAGSKWSLSALLAHLQHDLRVLHDPERLRTQIREIICKTIIAAEAHLTPLVHACVKTPGVRCYELFGFDILLDRTLTPWLIEVNVSPSLMGGSPLDRRIKGLLLSDMFHLVGVPVALSSLPPGKLPKDLEALRGEAAGGGSVFPSPSAHGSRQQQHQYQQQRAPAAPVAALHRRPSAGRQPSSASSTAGAAAAARRASSSSSVRAVNKKLHEVVLDPAIAVFERSHLTLFSASDWAMIHSMEDEMDRLGHFERIFPSSEPDASHAKYASFFTCQRYSDALCAKWIRSQQQQKGSRSRRQVPLPKPRQQSQSQQPQSQSQSLSRQVRW